MNSYNGVVPVMKEWTLDTHSSIQESKNSMLCEEVRHEKTCPVWFCKYETLAGEVIYGGSNQIGGCLWWEGD